MSTSGSKSNEHVAHFLIDIHNLNSLTWKIYNDEYRYISRILEFLLIEYENLFGVDYMNNEECIIYNDPNAKCPMLITNSSPIHIRLAQSSTSYWAQMIYQLSHELCHYAFRQAKLDKSYTLSWFEEIVCESMSLYALDYTSKNWMKCELSGINQEYNKAIEDYFNNELNSDCNDGFKNAIKKDALKEYEKMEKENRVSRKKERNIIYSAIRNNPRNVRCLMNYQEYLIVPDLISINFTEWKKATACSLLDIIESFFNS
ncbi:MAG: hypothetical protein Q4F78_05400 [Bacillota bacterium]|nr:hypothetical protein [Bacillota bacterium]